MHVAEPISAGVWFTFCKAVVARPLQFTPASPTATPRVPEGLLTPRASTLLSPNTPCLPCVVTAT